MTGDKLKGGVRINRYEKEVNRADMDTAADLARLLKVPLAFLFSDDDDEAKMLLAFSRLPPEIRAKLAATVEQLASDTSDGASLGDTPEP